MAYAIERSHLPLPTQQQCLYELGTVNHISEQLDRKMGRTSISQRHMSEIAFHDHMYDAVNQQILPGSALLKQSQGLLVPCSYMQIKAAGMWLRHVLCPITPDTLLQCM